MATPLDRALPAYREHAYALLRIVSGALFLCHGLQKLFGLLTTSSTATFLTQRWFGGLIELGCGTLIAIGLFTRPAAFLASGMMAVAYFQFHWKMQLGDRLFPIVNKGEPAVVYCFLFLYIACKGAGMWRVGRRE